MHQSPVLLLIDLQMAILHPKWGVRNNPEAEERIGALLAFWRARGWPVWHVAHDEPNPNSSYHTHGPGNAFRPEFTPEAGEVVIRKSVNNAFIGTGLEDKLRAGGHQRLVVAGVITNNSVDATVRMAGNLGFDTILVADGCYTFGRKDWNGRDWSAEDVHALSLANLDGEYCRVVAAVPLLTELSGAQRS